MVVLYEFHTKMTNLNMALLQKACISCTRWSPNRYVYRLTIGHQTFIRKHPIETSTFYSHSTLIHQDNSDHKGRALHLYRISSVAMLVIQRGASLGKQTWTYECLFWGPPLQVLARSKRSLDITYIWGESSAAIWTSKWIVNSKQKSHEIRKTAPSQPT